MFFFCLFVNWFVLLSCIISLYLAALILLYLVVHLYRFWLFPHYYYHFFEFKQQQKILFFLIQIDSIAPPPLPPPPPRLPVIVVRSLVDEDDADDEEHFFFVGWKCLVWSWFSLQLLTVVEHFKPRPPPPFWFLAYWCTWMSLHSVMGLFWR